MPKKSGRRRVGEAKRIPLRKRMDVTRAEFNEVIAMLNERGEILNDLRRNQDIQLQRIAQLQAELDVIARAWKKFQRGAQ
jgi:hypothetical protein